MSNTTFTLFDGLQIGTTKHMEVELRVPNAGDIIDGGMESERLVPTPDGGFVLVQSPYMVGLNVLRRQIVRIGSHRGPISLSELRMLSRDDLGLIQQRAEQLDQALAQGISDRGRAAAPGDGANQS
jgi:phage FluMu protein gp41